MRSERSFVWKLSGCTSLFLSSITFWKSGKCMEQGPVRKNSSSQYKRPFLSSSPSLDRESSALAPVFYLRRCSPLKYLGKRPEYVETWVKFSFQSKFHGIFANILNSAAYGFSNILRRVAFGSLKAGKQWKSSISQLTLFNYSLEIIHTHVPH